LQCNDLTSHAHDVIATPPKLQQSQKQRNSLSKVEIYLDDQQVNSLKSILTQSEVGIHVLFDNQLISEVFKNPFSEEEFFDVENIKKAQDEILQLLQCKSLTEKKNYIYSLPPQSQQRVVRAYFYIIENNLRTQQKHTH
jgi:hypothetical protein